MNQQEVKSLICHIIAGDKASFRTLVEKHQAYVYAVAFRILCDKYETEEVVQETFIRVWKKLKDFDTKMKFSTWLYKIIVNICFDKMRTNKVQSRIYDDFDLNIINTPASDNIESELINKEYARIICLLTAELTPKQKIVFTLSELEGLSSEEICEITGLSAKKIKSNLYCARQAIRTKLMKIA